MINQCREPHFSFSVKSFLLLLRAENILMNAFYYCLRIKSKLLPTTYKILKLLIIWFPLSFSKLISHHFLHSSGFFQFSRQSPLSFLQASFELESSPLLPLLLQLDIIAHPLGLGEMSHHPRSLYWPPEVCICHIYEVPGNLNFHNSSTYSTLS